MLARGTPHPIALPAAVGGAMKRVCGWDFATCGMVPGSRWSSCQWVAMTRSTSSSSGAIGDGAARPRSKIAFTELER